ncbi:MAG TPA: hypothetical protein VHS56_04300 [Candidatus Cybelea sp.]|nr:hypothetical protein [Candidatus Cybelea sp.]
MLPFLALSVLLADVAPAPSAATAYYDYALHATREAPQPLAAQYRTKISATGMKFDVRPYRGEADLAIGYGTGMKSSEEFDSQYSAATGDVTALIGATPSRVRIPLFNPTWSGIAAWMKYGFDGPPAEHGDSASGAVAATSSPAPTASANALRTIATVTAIDPGGYDITDGGFAACSDGAPGHRLLLKARRDPDHHPLTAVIVDTKTMRFCTMDFRLGASSALSFTGAFELHLGDVAGDWLVKDGTADFQIRVLGISSSHAHIVFSNDGFTFGPLDRGALHRFDGGS